MPNIIGNSTNPPSTFRDLADAYRISSQQLARQNQLEEIKLRVTNIQKDQEEIRGLAERIKANVTRSKQTQSTQTSATPSQSAASLRDDLAHCASCSCGHRATPSRRLTPPIQ